jgi:hypothetical protein
MSEFSEESALSKQPVHRHVSPWVMVPTLLVGGLIMGFGVKSALGDARDAHPVALAAHIVGFDLAHDLVFAPVILLVGWLVKRIVPAYARGPVRAALATSLMFVVFSYPLVRRWGQRRGNPSTLPLPYGTNLAIILVIVWCIAAAVIIRNKQLARRDS